MSLWNGIRQIHQEYPDAFWVIEDVGRPRVGSRLDAVHTFSKHRGHLEMALIAIGVASRSIFIPPDVWMTRLVPTKEWPHGNEPAQIKARKKFFHAFARQRVPELSFPQYAGDAVCITLAGQEMLDEQ